jgi:hypothetical protein
MGNNWLARSHQQLYDDLGAGPGVSAGEMTLRTYDALADALHESQDTVRAGLNKLAEAWQGEAAEQGHSAINAVQGWSVEATVGVMMARNQSVQQVEAYSYARNSMPPPVPVPDMGAQNGPGLLSFLATDQVVAVAASQNAHEEAARVMTQYEAASSSTLTALPTYSAPPEIGMAAPSTGGVDTTGGKTTITRTGPLAKPGSQPSPPDRTGQPNPPGSQPVIPPPHDDRTNLSKAPILVSPPRRPVLFPPPSPVPPQPGPPTWPVPPPSAAPPGGGEYGRGVGGPTGDPSERTGGRSSGRSGGVSGDDESGRRVTRGGDGRSGTGRPGALGVPEERTTGRGAGGARGGAGQPGMMGGGAGGRGDEDTEHVRKYVIDEDNFFTDGIPSVMPPVIGMDDEDV